jgi:cysteinyl-tRNA synthetase
LQALKFHSARQMRLMFLLQAWDKPMYYSDQVMDDAKAKEAHVRLGCRRPCRAGRCLVLARLYTQLVLDWYSRLWSQFKNFFGTVKAILRDDWPKRRQARPSAVAHFRAKAGLAFGRPLRPCEGHAM